MTYYIHDSYFDQRTDFYYVKDEDTIKFNFLENSSGSLDGNKVLLENHLENTKSIRDVCYARVIAASLFNAGYELKEKHEYCYLEKVEIPHFEEEKDFFLIKRDILVRFTFVNGQVVVSDDESNQLESIREAKATASSLLSSGFQIREIDEYHHTRSRGC